MTTFNKGKVYLVGAGPGDPDLLTVKASRLLKKCDALIYDSLIPKEFLKYTSNSCRHYFVGKRRRDHTFTQDQINKFLVELAKDHSCIVRLKGGDPFLFGRGGEEAEWLVRNGIEVEVVPGITSGMAAPTYMGIPLTHREAASSVTFVTGHEGDNKKCHTVNWRALANASDGLVIYMGMHNLDYIVNELISGGLDPSTPSAIIHQATLLNQRCIKAPLNKLLKEKKSNGILSPSIVVVGEIINHQIDKCSPIPSHLTLTKLKDLMSFRNEKECISVDI